MLLPSLHSPRYLQSFPIPFPPVLFFNQGLMSCVRVQLYHSSFSSLFTSFAIRESSFILAISPFSPSIVPLSILHPMQRQVNGSVCVWSSNIRLVNVQTIYSQMRLGPTSPVRIGNYLPGLHIMPGK